MATSSLVHILLTRSGPEGDQVEVWGPSPDRPWLQAARRPEDHPAEVAMTAAEQVLGAPVVWSLRRLDSGEGEAWLQILVEAPIASGQWTGLDHLLPSWPPSVRRRLETTPAEV